MALRIVLSHINFVITLLVAVVQRLVSPDNVPAFSFETYSYDISHSF